MDWPSLYLKSYDFDRACLPGVRFEPVVFHANYSPRRQYITKSLQFIFCYAKNKTLTYQLINTTKDKENDNFFNCSIEIVVYF